ncbi:MAG: glutamate racemase [Bdellovibrionales bacterium]|nr:glutamate racemase [Bdellovibrionales bacterium]
MSAAIGVFDSGIGGLSVLKALINVLPHESFVYLGDTARLPYGNKSPHTISHYVKKNTGYLKTLNIKALVIACNSASSVVVKGGPLENQITEFPVFNVIEPAAKLAIQATQNEKIGVIGTRATISSQVYVQALSHLDDQCQIFQRDCPLFVPLVEEGWIEDPLTNLVIHRYLQSLVACDIDSLILGCTHYPFLKQGIAKVCGSGVTLIDSAYAVAQEVKEAIENGKLEASTDPRGIWKIITTDNNELFKHLAHQFMGDIPLPEIEQVDI